MPRKTLELKDQWRRLFNFDVLYTYLSEIMRFHQCEVPTVQDVTSVFVAVNADNGTIYVLVTIIGFQIRQLTLDFPTGARN